MSSDPQASTQTVPGAPKARSGCGGCLRKGCGCSGLVLVVLLVLLFWPGGGGEPQRGLAYFPATATVAHHTERLDLETDAVHPDLSAELKKWALALVRRSGQEPATLSQLNCQGPQVVILQVADAQKALAALAVPPDRFEPIGKQRLYPLDGEPSRAVAVLDRETFAAGDLAAVRSVVAVAAGKSDSIYQGRPDLRPLLAAYSGMQAATYMLQPSAAAAVADTARRIAGAVSSGNPLLSLLGVRGMAFGARQDDQVCMVSLGFQYNNRLAATIVASVYRFFAVFNAVPIGIPEKLGSPQSVDVHQDRGLAMTTAYFSVEKCQALQKENGQAPAERKRNDGTRSPLPRQRSNRIRSRPRPPGHG